MIRDNNKCILCRRCSAVCEKVQGIGVIGPNHRGFATSIGSAFEMGLGDTSCVSCGQCIAVCPTAVSYTHLDVYKRQGVWSRGNYVLWVYCGQL